MMGEQGVKYSFYKHHKGISIIEGVMGLYDGKGLTEECSTYSISKVLNNAPIILVITPKAQSITLCAEINGIKNFRNANIVGVVLNCVSESFYSLLKPAIEMHCGLKVFGYVPKDDELKLESRHLGLVQSVEVEGLNKKINYLAELIEKYQKAALPDTPWVTHTLDTKKGSYGFRNCLISFWYRERDLNSQDVAIGGF